MFQISPTCLFVYLGILHHSKTGTLSHLYTHKFRSWVNQEQKVREIDRLRGEKSQSAGQSQRNIGKVDVLLRESDASATNAPIYKSKIAFLVRPRSCSQKRFHINLVSCVSVFCLHLEVVSSIKGKKLASSTNVTKKKKKLDLVFDFLEEKNCQKRIKRTMSK